MNNQVADARQTLKHIILIISKVVGWRDVPYDNSMIGKTAVDSQPLIRQVFIITGMLLLPYNTLNCSVLVYGARTFM